MKKDRDKNSFKKGFTLVELIVVVALLIVVAGIFSVNLIRSLNNQKDETNKSITAQIVSAANAYVSMNPSAVEKLYVSAGYVDIPIGILRDNGFLSEEITDAQTGENVKDEELVRVQLGVLDHLDYIYPANGEDDNDNVVDAWTLRADAIVLSVDESGSNWCSANAFYGLVKNISDMTTIDSKLYLQYVGTGANESKFYTGNDYFSKDGVNLQATCNVDITKTGTYNINYTYNDPDLKVQKSATRIVYVRGSDSDISSFTASIKTAPLVAGYTNKDDVLIEIIENTKNGDRIPQTIKVKDLKDNGYKIDNFDVSKAHTGKARVTRTEANSDGTMPKPTYRDINYTVYNRGYKLTFDYNNGTNTKNTVDINYGATITFPSPAPSMSGYTFKGWSFKSSNGTVLPNNSIYTFTEDKTLYGQWNANEYTVTFNYNGGSGSMSSKNVKFGASYGTLPTPSSRAGYVFNGWYSSSTGGTRITDSSLVNIPNNHTLYARWTPVTYTLYFNANGGSVTTSSKTISYNSTYGTLPTPTREGYTFNGWYTSSSGGTQMTSSSTYTLTTNQTLYAQWTARTITITFNANGGSVTQSSKTITAPTSSTTYGTLPTPSRTGYTFLGWYTSTSGGTQKTSSSVLNSTSNHTLYAMWTPVKYTVTFYIDGSKYSSTTVDYMSQYYMSTPTKTGYKFDGWYTTSSKTTKVGSGAYRTLNTAGNVSLYGFWQQSTVTVNFNANGGTITSGSSSRTLNAGSTLGTLPTAENGCSSFAGWYTASSGGSRIYTSTTVNSNTTYYAHWSASNDFKITFNPNGGKVTPSYICMLKTISYPNDMYPSLPVPYRSGYYFSGFWRTPDGYGKDKGASLYSKTDHTLTAEWYTSTSGPSNRWYSSTCNAFLACEEACKVNRSYSDGSKSISTCRVNSYGGGCSGYQTPPSSCSAYWD